MQAPFEIRVNFVCFPVIENKICLNTFCSLSTYIRRNRSFYIYQMLRYIIPGYEIVLRNTFKFLWSDI